MNVGTTCNTTVADTGLLPASIQSSKRWILFLVFAFAFFLILNNHSILVPERGDQAMWDYMAQAIVRGQVPYRDVVNIKTPLSAYISALAILVGKAFGFNQLIAIRYVGLIEAGVLMVVTFAVARAYTRSLLAATVSVLVPLTWERLYYFASAGTEPKLPMILFGMLSLLLIHKNKPFWAGFASMLSCLCWQPGLLFTGTAVLVFSNYLRGWRDGRAARTLIGAALPVLVMTTYFYFAGGLGELWKWCFVFDLTSYAPSAYKGFGDKVDHISAVVGRTFTRTGIVILIAAAAGFVMFFVRVTGLLHRPARAESVRPLQAGSAGGALLLAPLVYLIYLRFDFNAFPYLIPLIPFIGVFAGYFASSLIGVPGTGLPGIARILGRLTWSRPRRPESRPNNSANRPFPRIELRTCAGFIVAALAAYLAVATSVRTRYTGSTLGDEYTLVQPLADALEATDEIWAQGEINVLVLLERPNASKYIWFDRGKDDFAAQDTGGFQHLLDEIEAKKPRFVALGRMEGVHHRNEIDQWISEHYLPFPMLGFQVYIRQ